MITQTIHEIHNPFDGYARKLGHCLVMFYISGSVTSNPQFTVRFYHKGIMRTVDQNDLIIFGNPSAGERLIPPIPKDWLADEDLNNPKYASNEKLTIYHPHYL